MRKAPRQYQISETDVGIDGLCVHDLGVDLGTSNTLVYVKHKGIVISEPTIVVVDSSNERKVRAVGDDAKIMLGRTTEGVMAVRPCARA